MMMEMYLWLFFTAVVFTVAGYSMKKKKHDTELVLKAIDATIEKLIVEGYLKTKGSGDTLVILKYSDKV
jgi:hypothetical protein